MIVKYQNNYLIAIIVLIQLILEGKKTLQVFAMFSK